jgi:2,3-bisphosphoglycerate-independent phosphoglycerate mutase
MGLVSPGDVHSHQGSALAIARMAKELGLDRVHIHAFTDGRDMPPASAGPQIKAFEQKLDEIGVGKVRSLAGRYYAMDRDNRWDRIEHVYKMLTDDEHATHHNSANYIQESYANGEYDEFLKPISIAKRSEDRVKLRDGDVVIHFNFRPDRARQLTRAFIDADFQEFSRNRVIHNLHFVTLTEFDRSFATQIAFPKSDITETLAEVISKAGKSQFHVAETEKYAHVTYFFNGGREQAFPHENRLLIPSPNVATYDQEPAMSAEAVTLAVINRLNSHDDDFIVVNFANPDMVGHTGILKATQDAIDMVDRCVGNIVAAALKKDGVALVTSDHGNAEKNTDTEKHTRLTAHTTSPVPVILCGTSAKDLRDEGSLQDIAPTILSIMGLPTPEAMTGHTLIKD